MTVISADVDAGLDVLPGVADAVRLAVLQATGLLDGEADVTLDNFARLAAALLQTPNAYVTLVDRNRQVAPGAVELDNAEPPLRTIALQESICQFQIVTGEPLVIDDTRIDPLSERKAAVVNGSLLAYAGVPLTTRSGHVLGSLCVADRRRRHWTPIQVELLGELARLVVNDIEHRLAASRVASAEALARRTGHDIQDLLQAVSGLVQLAEREADPQLQRSAATARARSIPVELLVEELSEEVAELEVTAPAIREPVDLGRTVERAVAGARLTTGTTELDLVMPPGQILITGDPVQLEQAMVHLLVTALHHKTVGARLSVSLIAEQQAATPGVSSAALTLVARGGPVPAAELGRIVARFRTATGEEAGAPAGLAALRMVRGEVHVKSGAVEGRSSARSTSFRAVWPTNPQVAALMFTA